MPRHGNKQCELNKIAEPLLSQAMGNTMGKGRLAMLKESENSSSQQEKLFDTKYLVPSSWYQIVWYEVLGIILYRVHKTSRKDCCEVCGVLGAFPWKCDLELYTVDNNKLQCDSFHTTLLRFVV